MNTLIMLAALPLLGAEYVINVPEGQTVPQSADVDAVTEGDILVKMGRGTWQAGADATALGKTVNFSKVEVREGTMEIGTPKSRFYPQLIEIKSGATVKQTRDDSFDGRGVSVNVEEGGTWDLNTTVIGYLPNVSSLTGAGVLSGLKPNSSFSDWLAAKPDFTGTLSGGGSYVDGKTYTLNEALAQVKFLKGDGASSAFKFGAEGVPGEDATIAAKFTGSVRTYIYKNVDFRNLALWCSASGVETKIDDYGPWTVSGGFAAINPWYVMDKSPHVFTVRDAGVVGGAPVLRAQNTGAWLKRMTGIKYGPGTPVSYLTIRVVDGGRLYMGAAPGRLEVLTNGVVHTFGENASCTAYFDGGIWKLDTDNDGSGGFTSENASVFEIGPRGASFVQESQTQKGKIGLWTRIKTADGCLTDGGLTIDSQGAWTLYRPFEISGPLALSGGTFKFVNNSYTLAAKDSLMGAGDFEMGNASLDLPAAFETVKIAAEPGKRFVLSGAAGLLLNSGVAFGSPSAASVDAVLSRKSGGLLVVSKMGDTLLGDLDQKVVFSGGLACDAETGLVSNPLFYEGDYDESGQRHEIWDRIFYFTGYDTEKGVYAIADRSVGVEGGANSLARVSGQVLAENALARVAALDVIGSGYTAYLPYSQSASLTLNAGSRLTVGKDGQPYAYVLMNSSGSEKTAAIKGSGELDFGSREGVFVVNRRENACVMAKIVGTGGVTFSGSSANPGGSLHLNENAYSGGTWINALSVLAHSGRAFGTGKVTVGGGLGGAIAVEAEAEGQSFANGLKLAGLGAFGISARGALCFNTSAEWSGDIELEGTTRISVPAEAAEATLSGTVSGGRLEVFLSPSIVDQSDEPLPGELVMTSANTYTGGTAIVRGKLTLKGVGTAGTGRIEMDRGVLRLEPSENLNVVNDITGIGTVQVATKKNVTFGSHVLTDPIYCTELELDVAARRVQIDTLAGFSSVTSSNVGAVDLYVLDASPFAGPVAGNVTLHVGEKRPDKGLMLIFR